MQNPFDSLQRAVNVLYIAFADEEVQAGHSWILNLQIGRSGRTGNEYRSEGYFFHCSKYSALNQAWWPPILPGGEPVEVLPVDRAAG